MLTDEKLTEYLIEKYRPLAIILHGSRARGNNRPHSDWDVDLLVDRDTRAEQEVIDGCALDVASIRIDIDDRKIIETIGNTFSSVKVIFDTDDLGKNFVKKAQDLASEGYQLTSEEYQSRKSFLYRIINRLIDSREFNPIVFDYHLGNFIQRAVNYSFQVDNQWSKSIYEAIEDIQHNKPELFQELNLITSNIPDVEKTESAKRIYKLIFKESFE